MADYYVGNISIAGARAPSFSQQPVGPVTFTVGTSATVFIPFTVSDPNHTDTVTFSLSGTLPSGVTYSFNPTSVVDASVSGQAVLQLNFPAGGTAASANIAIIADDGTGSE